MNSLTRLTSAIFLLILTITNYEHLAYAVPNVACGVLTTAERNRCGGLGRECDTGERCTLTSSTGTITSYECQEDLRCYSFRSENDSCTLGVDTCCVGPVSTSFNGCVSGRTGTCYSNVCVSCLPPGALAQTTIFCCSGSKADDGYGNYRCTASGCANTSEVCGNSDVGITKNCCDSVNNVCKLNSFTGGMSCERNNTSGCHTSGSCSSTQPCCSGYTCSSSNVCVANTVTTPVGRYTGPLTSFTELLKSAYTLLYPIGLGIGAFFILLSGYCFMTSEGEPQAIKGCQEQFTGAIAGTLFILLSITLLRVIIGSILGVPGGF